MSFFGVITTLVGGRGREASVDPGSVLGCNRLVVLRKR
jgi:hypothetical protein